MSLSQAEVENSARWFGQSDPRRFNLVKMPTGHTRNVRYGWLLQEILPNQDAELILHIVLLYLLVELGENGAKKGLGSYSPSLMKIIHLLSHNSGDVKMTCTLLLI